MDLIMSALFIGMVIIIMQLSKITALLGKVVAASELSVKRLDAHEELIRKANEESARQGSDIDNIKQIISSKV